MPKRGEESVSYIATVKATSTTSFLCPSPPSQANKGSGGPRMRRTEGGRPEPVLHPSATPGCIFPTGKKERAADLVPEPGPPAAKECRPPGEEGEPAAPRPLRLLRALNFTECGRSGGAARGGAGAGKPRRRPRSPGQPPAFFRPAARGGGGAAATRVLPAPAAGGRAARRGSAAAAEDQLLEEAEKEREEPRGGKGGRGPSGSRERHRVSAHLAPSAMAG
ncbi:translation initiation factor IF-2-like [Acinonyx jubatus]|uniref:Translation initiation factor IF-2-like n=1 Tax=Acinonyx jubatus TaxID=32536 RepID=A0A6J2A1G3_ACIJB|nr:translation initiation factor IF-2-like [Acinonyx jubatus]